MCITTLYPIYEYYYPDADDEEIALQAAGTEAKIMIDGMAQGTPMDGMAQGTQMEEVAGFSLPAAAPSAQAYPVSIAQSDLEPPQQTGQV